jgi:hypothetical protein
MSCGCCFTVGDRIRDSDGYRGTIRYMGPVAAAKKKDETWLGIEWDEASRGKHNGSCTDSEGAIHNYFLCLDNAGSFVKQNKVNGGYSFVAALQERYVAKDAPSITSETDKTLPDAFVVTSKGNELPIELLGEEKIRKWQQIETIDRVAIRNANVSSIGDELKSLAGHFVEVDLQDNLLYKWTDVALLTNEIEGLETLLLHGNRLENLTAPLLSDINASYPSAFNSLKTLALNGCKINSWSSILMLQPHLKNLEQLYLSRNELLDLPVIIDPQEREEDIALKSTLPETISTVFSTLDVTDKENNDSYASKSNADAFLDASIWPTLKVLDISNCGLTEWSQVAYFKNLVSLEELLVDGNDVTKVGRFDKDGGGFATLSRLSISSSKLDTWKSIDNLSSFSSISNLRVSHIPLFAGKGASEVRPEVIGRMANLSFFNGSGISPRERIDSEKLYLRRILKDIEDAIQLGRPLDEKAIFLLHPRQAALKDQHGADLLPMGNMAAGGSMSAELLSVTFQNLAFGATNSRYDPIVKKLPASLTLEKTKMMVKQLFNVDPAVQLLSLRCYKDSPPVLLDDDQVSLAYYGCINGAEIFINEVDEKNPVST